MQRRLSMLDQDHVSRALRGIAEAQILSYGDPTPIARSDVKARLGDLVLLDPSDGAIVVTLPTFGTSDIGRAITIVNRSSSETAWTLRSESGTVNGEASVTVERGYGVRQAIAVNAATQLWLLTTVLDGAVDAAAQPIWQWNGTDLTQFGAVTKGSGVTSATASVVTAYGVSWIQIEQDENSGVGAYNANKSSCLPISTAFDSSIRIEADVYVAAGASGGYVGWGLCARFDPTAGSTTPGTGLVAYHLGNVSAGRGVHLYSATAQTAVHEQTEGGYTSLTMLDRIELEIGLDAWMRAVLGGVAVGGVVSSAGSGTKAGLIAIAGGNSTTNGQIRFRRIRVWEAE